jgi:hypothetical protein
MTLGLGRQIGQRTLHKSCSLVRNDPRGFPLMLYMGREVGERDVIQH